MSDALANLITELQAAIDYHRPRLRMYKYVCDDRPYSADDSYAIDLHTDAWALRKHNCFTCIMKEPGEDFKVLYFAAICSGNEDLVDMLLDETNKLVGRRLEMLGVMLAGCGDFLALRVMLEAFKARYFPRRNES
ncbi:hypothetical protein HDV00_009320 [Rhizophlyctis rosea]|nr:hypothetical protein HDV00_009320 [Rhizophlyctis rosea]